MRYGYGRMTKASYELLRVRNPTTAREWLRAAPITSGGTMDPPPASALQVAFTAPGCGNRNFEDRHASFSPEFLAGMTEESRIRRLGDVAHNSPSQWAWGYAGNVPHLVVMFFGGPGGLTSIRPKPTGPGRNDAFEMR